MRKKVIAMDLTKSKVGGPYRSTMNIVNSELKDKYDFRTFEYDPTIGRKISIRRVLDLYRKIKSLNPDIVHFTGLQLSGFHVALAARLACVRKRIVVVHGSSLEAIKFSWISRVSLFILEWMTICLSTSCYGVSEYSSKLFVPRLFKKKNRGFIYNLPTVQYDRSADVKREDFGFTSDDVVVVSVARITREKGYEVLAESIKLDSGLGIKYLIVGDGEYLSAMKKELSEYIKSGKVCFTGYRTDIGAILECCDIFVLPTLHETLSISLLEASRAGLPMVATKVGGCPEIVIDGFNGILVEPSDSKGLYDAVLSLAENRERRNEMGKNALEVLSEKFDSEKILNQIEKLYEED